MGASFERGGQDAGGSPMLVINEACADSQKNVVKCGKTKAGRQR